MQKNDNMKRPFNVMITLSIVMMFVLSCSDDYPIVDNEINIPIENAEHHTIQMKFNGGIERYSEGANKSLISATWSEGDVVYMTFYNGNSIVPGVATYEGDDKWSISCDGNLPIGEGLKCEARFFVNATSSTSAVVHLNSNTEIYEDQNALYVYDGKILNVYASLSPKTGRVRFSGNNNTRIHITGVSVYTTFSPATNQFTISEGMITSDVSSDGYTPYIYGYFTDEEKSLGLIESDCAFTRKFAENILAPGQSGYMAIPSESAHNKWRSGLYVMACGVEFKMIPVSGYSDGFFLIGETEVTIALFVSVNGRVSNSQLPVSGIPYSEMTSFIEKLNDITKLKFSLPTTKQWLYAAKGGAKSQGYTYSGSNTPGDVAWYSANTSSMQNVKSKAPNELGIYDMSGNVGEYSTSKDVCGGCYKSPLNYITAAAVANPVYGSWEHSGYELRNDGADWGIGFRLILTCE